MKELEDLGKKHLTENFITFSHKKLFDSQNMQSFYLQ